VFVDESKHSDLWSRKWDTHTHVFVDTSKSIRDMVSGFVFGTSNRWAT
jgi:hypothetical protein